jgi:hypothetical protein
MHLFVHTTDLNPVGDYLFWGRGPSSEPRMAPVWRKLAEDVAAAAKSGETTLQNHYDRLKLVSSPSAPIYFTFSQESET